MFSLSTNQFSLYFFFLLTATIFFNTSIFGYDDTHVNSMCLKKSHVKVIENKLTGKKKVEKCHRYIKKVSKGHVQTL